MQGIFSTLADEVVSEGLATRRTMMGQRCLHASGSFVASGGRTGDLFAVKLGEDRVREEIEAGRGQVFAPSGRVFKNWVEVTDPSLAHARTLLFEALERAAAP